MIDVATGQPLKSLVSNDGTVRANGGRVELTAAAARAVVDSVINNSGVIKANSVGRHNGMIVLSAATAGSKPAGRPTQTIKVSGTIAAAGKKGQQGRHDPRHRRGHQVRERTRRCVRPRRRRQGADRRRLGRRQANTSLVNNQSAKLETFAIATATTVTVDAATTINASATGHGNGGKVVLWSDSQTTFAGTILARGGAQER